MREALTAPMQPFGVPAAPARDGLAARVRTRAVRLVPGAARVLLGLLFFVTGLNGFLNFLPQPASLPEGVAAFAGALAKTGYMLPLLAGTQLLAGALLLANRYVPLALALLAPVIVNILALHAFLDPSGIGPGALAAALELYLAWTYRSAYRGMLAARVS